MISTWLLLCLLAARASGRPGFAWRLEVGCDINGFFVELLGLLPALETIIPGGVVVRGLRCDERELAKLFPGEAAAVARATLRDDDPSVPEIVHGRCGEGVSHAQLPVYVYGQARPRAARLMVERARGAGDAETYSCAARAAVVVAPTLWNAEQFGDHAVVAPEAVDPALFSPAAAARDDDARASIEALLGPKRKTFRVLSIFKWERRKAPDVLVDGFFRAFQDESAELVIHAYRPSWERGEKDLRRVAERMRPAGNKARLAWLGGVELSRRELRALYAAVDCFALPTRGEGWGLPVHEALAMALPTVVTGVAGPLDITGGNGTAWLLDPGGRGADGLARPRPEDLATALREIRDDPAEALKRAAAGRERVARLFAPSVVARRFVEALGEGFFLHDEL